MSIPNKPSLANPDLALKTTWGGTKATYTNDEITNGHGLGTPLGREIKSTLLNHDKQYDIEWINHNASAIDYLGQNTELYTDSGTANAIVLTVNSGEPITSYYSGLKVRFLKNVTNTGAVTINADGVGVKSLVNVDGSALSSGILVNTRYYEAVYNGTAFVLSAGLSQTSNTDILTTKGDLLGFGSNYLRLPVGSKGQVLTVDSAETAGIKWAYDYTANMSDAPTLANGTDADHDIDFTAGFCYDLTTKVKITLASAITKQFDATFVAGTGAGGFASGESLPTSGTIHIWLISKADGTTDVFANNHATSGLTPTLPTDYVNKRRIASLKTNASANIIPFLQDNNLFLIKSPTKDISTTTSTSSTTHTLPVPTGIKVKIDLVINIAFGTDAYGWLRGLDQVDLTPSSSFYNVANLGGNSSTMQLLTNTSGQIYTRFSVAGVGLQLYTIGWTDERLA